MLTVRPPSLLYEGRETGRAALEQPIDVLVEAVTSDDAPVGPERLATFGYFVMRRSAPGSAPDVWDEGTSTWTSELMTGVDRVPAQLAYQPDGPQPWRGIIVGAGGRDAVGSPRFVKAVAGYPRYWVRAFFVMADGSESVLSGPSENVTFIGASDRNLMVMGPGDGEEPSDATQARLLLRTTTLQTIGGLVVERDAPGAAVTLVNAAGASVALHPDGRIELTPAPGERVVVSGDLETEHVVYLPAGGTVKQALG
jgi:hypothetical protein